MDLNYERLFKELVLALSKVLDIDDARKLSHAQRTAVLAYLLASNLCPEEESSIYYAALLHDIGGIGLFNHIVHHPSPKVQAANAGIRVHPVVGAQIVENIPGLEPCVPIILNHHERYDGHGYPGGKGIERIPQGAQIVRAADAFDLIMYNTVEPQVSALKMEFAQKAEREISPEIADLICQFMDDHGTFSLLVEKEAIQEKCLELNQTLPGVEVILGTDVIGTLLEVFAQVIDTKHAYTAGHSYRVSKYSVQVGLAMDLPHDDITKLKWAALVHDLGKVSVPRSVLNSSLSLSKEEFELIKQHPKLTIEVLSCVSELKELGHIGTYHHERWDGKGYPEGLKGEQIPLLSRIITIADAFDAVTSDSSYQQATGTRNALARLTECSGTQFDPRIFDIAKLVLWSRVD